MSVKEVRAARRQTGARAELLPTDITPVHLETHMKTSLTRIFRFVLLAALIPAGGIAAADSSGHRGHGHGDGMMGMAGHGMGMTGPMHLPDLTDAQRGKINAIADDNRKKMWQLIGQRMDEQAKLRDLYAAETLDAGKILAVYDRMHQLKREMVAGHIKAHNDMLAVLTKEQREQLKNRRRGMPMSPGGSRGGMPGPAMMGQ